VYEPLSLTLSRKRGATVFKSKGNLSGLGLEGMFLEDAVHLEEEFAHHGGQRDLGRFARRPQVRVELPQRRCFHPGQPHRAHVEGPAARRHDHPRCGAAPPKDRSMPHPKGPGPPAPRLPAGDCPIGQ